MKTYYLVGYLCPAAIVLTALAVDLFALGSDTYGTEVRLPQKYNRYKKKEIFLHLLDPLLDAPQPPVQPLLPPPPRARPHRQPEHASASHR